MKIAASILIWLTIILAIFSLVMTIFHVVTNLYKYGKIAILSCIITLITNLVTLIIGVNSGISPIEALLFRY